MGRESSDGDPTTAENPPRGSDRLTPVKERDQSKCNLSSALISWGRQVFVYEGLLGYSRVIIGSEAGGGR